MRLVPGVILSTLTTLTVAFAAPAAFAVSGAPGGAQAPSSAAAGGVEYGFPLGAVQRHPVITALNVPAAVSAGSPPKVTLRLDEPGVGTVFVTVIVTNLASRQAALVARMGWSRTARALTVRWPGGASLAAGSYQVSVTAHDHQGFSLLRRAHSSGRATLTVHAAPKPPPPPAPAPTPTPLPAPPPALEAGIPTPTQTPNNGAHFPVAGPHSFGNAENRFGAPRGSHTHQGQDVMTAEGTPLLAPMAGTIESTSYQAGGAGYYIVEHTGVGFDFVFDHCQLNTFAVSAGQPVAAGQLLCHAGQTGDASAPHLHFEIWVGGWQVAGGHPIDPLPYLEAWEHAGG